LKYCQKKHFVAFEPPFCRFSTSRGSISVISFVNHEFKGCKKINTDMKKTTTIFKSIGAVVAGLIFIVVTHSATDAALEAAGVLPKGNLYVGTGLILFVILYRAVFSVLGCYLTARLAPHNPMRHALTLGGIGVIFSSLGAIATADMNLGPAWYAWSLVVIALPMAWLGGRLFMATKKVHV
jgi:hypothetical protein